MKRIEFDIIRKDEFESGNNNQRESEFENENDKIEN
jgi:hypothetical protein